MRGGRRVVQRYEQDDDGHGSALRVKIFAGLVVVLAVGGFVWLAWYAYQSGSVPQREEDVPLVTADATPFRTKPDDPGGMEIPHRDKTVYDALAGTSNPPKVEALLPDEEEPILPEDRLVADSAAQAEVDLAASRQQILNGEQPQAAEPLFDAQAVEKQAKEAEPSQPPVPLISGEEAPMPDAEAPVVEVQPVAPAAPAAEAKPAPDAAPKEEKKIAAPAPKKEEPQKAETEQEKKPAAAPGSIWRVQLVAAKSQAEAEATWKKIRAAHGDVLGELGYTVEKADLGAKGVFYRLQVVPFASKEAAEAACKRLSSKKQGCFVVKR